MKVKSNVKAGPVTCTSYMHRDDFTSDNYPR